MWVRDEDEARLRCDGRDHRVEVVPQIGARHLDRARAENCRDQFVGDEGVLGRDHVVAAIEKCVPEKLDDFIRPAAENEVIAADSELRGERFAQIMAAAIGIEMRGFQRGAHCGQSFRRRSERIFVRGEFDDAACVRAQLARSFLNGLARFVDAQAAQLRIGDIPDG